MIIEILKAHGRWKPGDTPDLHRQAAVGLVEQGFARIHSDQTRRDYTPKTAEPEPQPITVNNYFLAPEPVEEPKPEQQEISKPKKNKLWPR